VIPVAHLPQSCHDCLGRGTKVAKAPIESNGSEKFRYWKYDKRIVYVSHHFVSRSDEAGEQLCAPTRFAKNSTRWQPGNINIRQRHRRRTGIAALCIRFYSVIKHMDNSVVELIGMIAGWAEREHHRVGGREHQYQVKTMMMCRARPC
jgi:hypothetical protein